jgi:hypothetical protein
MFQEQDSLALRFSQDRRTARRVRLSAIIMSVISNVLCAREARRANPGTCATGDSAVLFALKRKS